MPKLKDDSSLLRIAELDCQITDGSRKRFPIALGADLTIGRADCDIVVTDPHVSRSHVRVRWEEQGLLVERLPEARNPVFFKGQTENRFFVPSGGRFVIGSTSFTFEPAVVRDSIQTISVGELDQIPFEPNRQIEVLSQLPELISRCTNAQELCARLTDILGCGVRGTMYAAILEKTGDGNTTFDIVYRQIFFPIDGEIRPSRTLFRTASKKNQSAFFSVSEDRPESMAEGAAIDWAICTPVRQRGEREWFLYVAGKIEHQVGSRFDIRGNTKYVELVSSFLASLLNLNELQRENGVLSNLLPRNVLEEMGPDRDLLEPREAELVVMFTDLRGFSKMIEENQGNLLESYRFLSRALELSVRAISEQDGVIGDFHGDAVMGFWGWPARRDDVLERACAAAMSLRAEIERIRASQDNWMGKLDIGVGIAMGSAVAGLIGTDHQMKVSAIGNVVNLAARLEGMTKYLGVPVIVDAGIASGILAKGQSQYGFRRLGRYVPAGMKDSVELFELGDATAGMDWRHWERFEAAVSTYERGEWDQAFQQFCSLSFDRASMHFIQRLGAGQTPPNDWDGVIRMSDK